MNPSSLVFDLVCVALLVFTVLRYKKKGLLSGLVHLVGNLVSLVVANVLANAIGPQVFESMLRPRLEQEVTAAIGAGAVSLDDLIGGFASLVPADIPLHIRQLVDSAVASGAQAVINDVLEPLMVPAISLGIFVVVYLVCRVLVGVLARALQMANRLPVVGGANQALGVVMGIAIALLDLFLLLCVVYAISIVAAQGAYSAMLSGSFVYALFTRINPFLVH